MQITVAGPGLMGSQIGVEYALGGHDVTFLVRRPEEANRRVGLAFDLAAAMDRWPADLVLQARETVRFAASVPEMPATTAVFVESIAEDAREKGRLLAEAAVQAPEAILASNTSSISVGELGTAAGAPERTLGAHYWNPPLLMPMVELISGPQTRPELIDRLEETLRAFGKAPVRVQRDVPGFAWNRLQLALLREAVWLVENNVATPEVVDEIVRDGLARRWRYTGPFQTAALGGPETFTRVANNLWPELSTATELHDLHRWLIDDPATLAELKAARDAGLLGELGTGS